MPDRAVTPVIISALSVVLALVLWMYVTWDHPGKRRISVPVHYANVPVDLKANGIPSSIIADITGPRFDVLFMRTSGLFVNFDLAGFKDGWMEYVIGPEHITLPPGLRIVSLSPTRINVRLDRIRQ